MFEIYLSKYKSKGEFSFTPLEIFQEKCNAPSDKSGIYLIYKIINEEEVLIYIGSSGQKKDGILKTRKSGLGGMKDRLVSGYHPNNFGNIKRIKRKHLFPQQMKIQNIHQIKIYWWVTFDEQNSDFPTDVETILRNEYISKFNCLPEWHKNE